MNNNQILKENYPQVSPIQNQTKQPTPGPAPALAQQLGQAQLPPYPLTANPNFHPNGLNNQVPNYPAQQGLNLPPYSQPVMPQQGQSLPMNNGYPQGNLYPNMVPQPNYNQYNPPNGNFNPQNNGQNPIIYNQQSPYGQPSQYGQGMPAPQQGNNQNIMLKNLISRYSDEIFQKHDSNRSGLLDIKEIYPSVCELFGVCGIPKPEYPKVLAIMQMFDKDRNGLIDMPEFRTLMLKMNGF